MSEKTVFIKFIFLNNLTNHSLKNLYDVVADKRLHKYLFGELILNENAVRQAESMVKIPVIKKSLKRAAVYYEAFKYIFYDYRFYGGKPNNELERIIKNGIIKLKTPGTVKLKEFKENQTVWTKVLHNIPLKELKNL